MLCNYDFGRGDAIIVTNKRITIKKIDSFGIKNDLVLLKDVTSVSTFGTEILLSYYKGESGIIDSVLISTSEEGRIMEAIILKLINDMDEYKN